MKKVFLCHASEDKEYVRIVAKKLTRAKVIFDEMIFNVAEDFRDEIIRALDDTMIFVFIVSRKSWTTAHTLMAGMTDPRLADLKKDMEKVTVWTPRTVLNYVNKIKQTLE